MARIAIIGMGYVGLVTGAAFAERGHRVVAVDVVRKKVSMVNEGRSPIHEDGLAGLLERHVPERLRATTDLAEAMDGAEFVFIAVGTPSREDGAIDLTHVIAATESIRDHLAPEQIVVVKSTVLPGTTTGTILPILRAGRLAPDRFSIAVNPEFLREGVAVHDALNPDRVVIGAEREDVGRAVASLYGPGHGSVDRFHFTDLTTAEAIKYASNCILAVKISFANEVAALCEDLGIDVYEVMDGVGLDSRISRHFLNAGLGFGGSCLPKDTRALRYLFRERGIVPEILDAVDAVNRRQAERAVERVAGMLGGLEGRRIAVLGLAFKAETDDVRETQALPIIKGLLAGGADVVVHDPVAIPNCRRSFGLDVTYASSAGEALDGADAVIFQTAWSQYRTLSMSAFEKMGGRAVYDGRRALSPEQLDGLKERGFDVFLLGRGPY